MARQQITNEYIATAFQGFQTVFNDAFAAASSHHETLAMVVKSTTSEENYAWLGQFPALRQWIGERIVRQLAAHGFRITNEKFESTVTVKRDNLEDDQIGVYKPMFAEMGRVSKVHPDTMLFDTLAAGFTGAGFDGETFFSAKHPIDGMPLAALEAPLAPEFVRSNLQTTGTNEANEALTAANANGPAWYLLDLSRAIKPLIWQERTGYELQAITDPKNFGVFMTDEFLFGIRARVNCGYGLWQLAYASRFPLIGDNYAKVRADMMGHVGDKGQLLGIMPTHMIVPPSLEKDARRLLKTDNELSMRSNVWKDSVELIVTPWLR